MNESYSRRIGDSTELNRVFNVNQYWERVQAGELLAVLKTDRHRTHPTESLPFCTRNQIYLYYDHHGGKVAVVHQMMLPNWQIGGSGRPEPKAIWRAGELLNVD